MSRNMLGRLWGIVATPLGAILLVGATLLVLAACAPAATPSTATPSKPTAQVAPPTAKPSAAEPKAAGPSEGKTDWKTEWDQTVAAAKKEAKVRVAGGQGDMYRNAAAAFQKTYRDIALEFTGVIGSADFVPKIQTEREAGEFLWDVHFGGVSSMLSVLKPKGILDPLRPALVLPEVLDSSKWLGGFEDPWIDTDHKYVFGFAGGLRNLMMVNRDLVKESELSSIDQLLDAKWKGKISSSDPRTTGVGGQCFAYLLTVKGEDWLRKLLAQDLTILSDPRQGAEAVVRGSYPIGLCLDPPQFAAMQKEGLGANVKPLDPNNQAASQLSGGFGNVVLINRAPHPNAAKVFINWLLSREGQQAYVEATGFNSRRLDVAGPAETAPKPNVKYIDTQKEELQPNGVKARDIAKEIIK